MFSFNKYSNTDDAFLCSLQNYCKIHQAQLYQLPDLKYMFERYFVHKSKGACTLIHVVLKPGRVWQKYIFLFKINILKKWKLKN
jgi:hypothetical protein